MICSSFCSIGSVASIQWMVKPRRSMPRASFDDLTIYFRFSN